VNEEKERKSNNITNDPLKIYAREVHTHTHTQEK
jgi:hypothetical protein